MLHGRGSRAVLGMAFALAIGSLGRAETQPGQIDPRADAQLRKMSGFLAQQQAFSVHTNSKLEPAVTGQGAPREASGDLLEQRPNKLRVDRTGPNGPVVVVYDGKQFLVANPTKKVYAMAPAPKTTDETLDLVDERLAWSPPAADLLYSDPYSQLTDGLVSSRYVGRETVNGQPAHHLQLTNDAAVSDIWIADGDRPLPQKLVVAPINGPDCARYTATFDRWNLNPKIDPNAFTFRPPEGSQRISFARPPAPPTGVGGGGGE